MVHKSSIKHVLTLRSDPKEVARVEIFLEKLNKKLKLDDLHFNKLLVVTTEAVNNSIIHGNRRDPEKKITIICEINRHVLIVHVEDEGPGVDPEKLPNPLSEENLLRENGRGVFLMRSLMDDVKFKRTSKGASVIMKMNLN